MADLHILQVPNAPTSVEDIGLPVSAAFAEHRRIMIQSLEEVLHGVKSGKIDSIVMAADYVEGGTKAYPECAYGLLRALGLTARLQLLINERIEKELGT